MILALTVTAATALLLAGALARQLVARARTAEAQAAELRADRDASGYADLQGRTVVILTTERQSYRGVLARTYRDGHRLVSPSLMADAQPTDLGGEIFIDRQKVALIQIPEPAAGN